MSSNEKSGPEAAAQRVLRPDLRTIAANYVAAMAILSLGYGLVTHHPYYLKLFSDDQRSLFGYVYLAYALLLPIYYTTLPAAHTTKSRLFWRALANVFSRGLTGEEKVALRAVAVKAFFLPMMLVWMVHHATETVVYVKAWLSDPQVFASGYWLLFNIIFLVDVGFFTVGYAVEHPKLDNEIRSVEPTATGWIVTLLCYPPFNEATQTMLGWHSSDYPEFEALWAQFIFGVAILLLLVIYAWASVALNLKASNLTHRGIVDHGPYRWVRHPAYTAKNLAWWLGSIPILMQAFQRDHAEFFYALLSVLLWSVLYYLRAVTEERHLSMDPVYVDYCRRVPYRLIPKIW